MPGWHDATKELQDEGRIRMVGIIQEQHPDRARLFMQWKEMGWPILVDSYDLLEAPYVPITLAIDENGIIREVLRPLQDVGKLDAAFLEETFGDGPAEPAPPARRPDVGALLAEARREDTAEAWEAYADAVAVWGGPGRVDQAIEAYERAVALAPDDGMAHFRLGVAHRMRYDSEGKREGDFQAAVDHWSRALEIDPNQYIWRRRIQQYGPRLDKPYPFYDWVVTAREEIRARGGEPAPLEVEPRGSEFAEPVEDFQAEAGPAAEPDPDGRVRRDEGDFVDAEVVAVPASVEPGGATRVHVVLRPIEERRAHWNNEAEETVLWVEPPDGWEVDRSLHVHPIPRELVTDEPRSLEVEVRAPEDARPGAVTIDAYALYYVCEDINGICLFRRQDLPVEVRVR